MTGWDWLIVLLINGSIIGYGLYLARGKQTSGEWFLAARSLPWWAVGLSMFATNVDNADLVGVTGTTFKEGLHIISVYAVGSAVGAILAAYFLVPQISRRGLYTNAEYLESRFDPATRVFSALIQIQYRTSMLGLMIWSTYLVLTQLVEITPAEAWTLIVLLVILSGCYTAWGGLKSVVWTDAAQGVVMIVAALVIFWAIYDAVGGWQALEAKLAQMPSETGQSLADRLHIGRYRGDHNAVSPLWIVVGWTIIGAGYWTVNHTQTMRLMGCRSLAEMRYAATFGVLLSLPIMIVSASLGVFGLGIENLAGSEQIAENSDELYPLLANMFLGPGLKGLVVAGMVAAVVSTFDSMGSALSAIFTRDVYARLIARDRSDEHYVLVGRWATGGVLLIGFLYLPFIWTQENMIKAFTTLIPVFVTPLFTIYMVGIFTRAHRLSGIVGLCFGSVYGVIALCDRNWYDFPWLPTWFTERWTATSWSLLFTALAMLITTLILGRESPGDEDRWQETGWLERSREELPPLANPDRRFTPFEIALAVGLLAVTGWVTFVLFW